MWYNLWYSITYIVELLDVLLPAPGDVAAVVLRVHFSWDQVVQTSFQAFNRRKITLQRIIVCMKSGKLCEQIRNLRLGTTASIT